jgi:hypothetical protein
MWAFTHAAVVSPHGLKVPDGSYVSWMNNGAMELLSEADVAYLNTHLNAAQQNALQMEKVYGPSIVYNRAMMEWLSQHHPDWNVTEWVDDHAAMLMKWGAPILSATRADWLDKLPSLPNSLIVQTPGHLGENTQKTLLDSDIPVVVTGRADLHDAAILKRLGLALEGDLIPADFHVATGDSGAIPPHDRPYLNAHQPVRAEAATVHYHTDKTPLITSHAGWIYWQPPDWSEPFNQFVPKYQLGSTFPHYYVASLLNDLACEAGLSHLETIERPTPIGFHLWRSAGKVYLLLGNLETGEFGDARTPRYITIRLSRRQLELPNATYHLSRVDVPSAETIASQTADSTWLTYAITLPPEQCAVYRVEG